MVHNNDYRRRIRIALGIEKFDKSVHIVHYTYCCWQFDSIHKDVVFAFWMWKVISCIMSVVKHKRFIE